MPDGFMSLASRYIAAQLMLMSVAGPTQSGTEARVRAIWGYCKRQDNVAAR